LEIENAQKTLMPLRVLLVDIVHCHTQDTPHFHRIIGSVRYEQRLVKGVGKEEHMLLFCMTGPKAHVRQRATQARWHKTLEFALCS
jgi:hypothetical protein